MVFTVPLSELDCIFWFLTSLKPRSTTQGTRQNIFDFFSFLQALQDILMFRYLVWLTKAVICGYERNWLNRGIHGVGSAFLLLELAHTHFWDQSIALEHELKASKQRVSLSLLLSLLL